MTNVCSFSKIKHTRKSMNRRLHTSLIFWEVPRHGSGQRNEPITPSQDNSKFIWKMLYCQLMLIANVICPNEISTFVNRRYFSEERSPVTLSLLYWLIFSHESCWRNSWRPLWISHTEDDIKYVTWKYSKAIIIWETC